MSVVTLSPGLQVVAFKLQEAMMQGDIRARLADAVNDAHRGTGSYGYYIDHSGDDASGDVVYSCNGDVRMCGYEIASVGGKVAVNLGMDDSKNVVPLTTYQEEADDDDHYASMEESFKAAKLYTTLPLYERFISKSERDSASSDDFAGKGKSFPILKASDVGAAVHAMGRAGSSNYGMAQLKANIIRIAKAKGFTSELPKTWRGDSTSASESLRTPPNTAYTLMQNGVQLSDSQAKALGLSVVSASDQRESDATANRGTLVLCESASTLETIVLKEAKADYEIKLIAPGKGSSAFYPKEVLQRDGPKVFKAGTHVYLNHPTAAEESARPEGDVKNLAGVLASDAVYNESHAKGPGLYARMKVFADHGQMVEEKAAHVGMSIRANGVAESGKQRDGLPILKELTSAESVDVVTRAGAGGMILTEAARPNSQEGEMTLQEAQKLIDEGIAKATSPLLERAIRGDAREEAERILSGTAFKEARFESARTKIVEAALRQIPKKDGALDVDEFRKIVAKEAKDMGDFLGTLMGTGEVRGMGPSFGAQPVDEEKLREAAKRQREDAKALDLEEAEIMSELTGLRLVKKEEAA
jgi:hypothetical protein